MKRILAVFLCLCLICMGGVPGSARADTVILYVGGTALVQDGSSVTGGSGTATLTYEDGNPVLTLNNYTYSGQGSSVAAIYYYSHTAPLTIRLVGNSSVTHEAGSGISESYGFFGLCPAVTIEGSGSLELYGGSGQRYSYGLHTEGTLTILGGKVEAVGADFNAVTEQGYSYGISCGQSLTIRGGTVIATAGDVTAPGEGYGAHSYGIYAHDDIEITGGAVEASAGAAYYSFGITGTAGKLNIGSGIDYVRAKGRHEAIVPQFKNAVPGTSWNNYEGTGTGETLPVSERYQREAYQHMYFERPVISAGVTFKVVNGEWDDGSSADKPVTVTGRQGDTLKLEAGDIPAVGGKPAAHYRAGGWDVTPNTTDAVTDGAVFTYTYEKVPQISYTVTFKVVNGEWDDGGSADIIKTLSRDENEDLLLMLTAGDIPAVGSKPARYYKAGSWDVTPSTDMVISKDKTFTYTYEKIPVTLEVTDTQGTEHEKQSGKDAVVTVKGVPDDRDTYKNFRSASVDGTELKIGRDADTAEGSLVLTIRSAYLDTLSEGDHTVTLAFANGTVETALKVKAAAPAPTKEPQPVPKTGDPSDLLLWGGLVILGILGMAALTAGRRRKE